jgi:acetyl-CoA synthetase
VERYRVTVLYTAPTAIRSHMKWGSEHAARHGLSSLRLLGTVGEPINPEAWVWYRSTSAAAAPRWSTPGGRPRPERARARRGRRLPGPAPSLAGHAPGALQRARPLRPDLLVALPRRLPRRRRGQAGRRRRLLAAGSGRRRDQRVGPPDLDHRGGERAGGPSARGRGGRVRPRRPGDRPGDRRLREPAGRRRRVPGDAPGAARARRPEDRQDRHAGEHRVHPGAAQDPLGQAHAPAAARRGRAAHPRRHHHPGRPGRGGGDPAPGRPPGPPASPPRAARGAGPGRRRRRRGGRRSG